MSDGGKSRSSSSFHFVAGLGSGLTSAVLLQPADLLKTRVQQSHSTTLLATLRSIVSGPSPIRSLWRGTVPSALRTGFGSALYFSTLNALRQSVARSAAAVQSHNDSSSAAATLLKGTASTAGTGHSSSLPKLSSMANLTTGAIARAGAGFIMMPITVIKVRYESSYYAYRTLWHAGSDILRTEGARGFFAGFGATAVRDAPYAGLYVLFYEESKKRMSRWLGGRSDNTAGTTRGVGPVKLAEENIPVMEVPAALSTSTSAGINFASGVVAACLGTALTNPFDAIKTRLQLMPRKYGNMARAARLMMAEEGARSLFDGLGIRIARKAISSALAWTVYEELIRRAETRFTERVAL
ncbi:solute carrier family 25 member 38 [Saccharata proteae CBS 121410]|uniref:Mitochondrial glycine transporter n=1 Tax=Saccharata proteae CBS 121410 TaxID=1314787 RepID=A0A6A5YBN9_9PEZI|nr:solute carrier family 25 member 38 [Saccharata proteae CBS 121410]